MEEEREDTHVLLITSLADLVVEVILVQQAPLTLEEVEEDTMLILVEVVTVAQVP